jgi:hypothetical protein
MNHLEVYQIEKYVPSWELRWVAWSTMVESILGHSIDGDQEQDGYSLDRAYSWFMTGASFQEYAKEIKNHPNYKKP